LAPQLVGEPTWQDYGTKYADQYGRPQALSMKQPFFHAYALSTSVSINNGQKILVGGGMPSRDGKRSVYAFITAKLIGPDGADVSTAKDINEWPASDF